MTTLDLLYRIPEERRKLLYISNRQEEEIYFPTCTYADYYRNDTEKKRGVYTQFSISDSERENDDDEVESIESSDFFENEKEANEFFEDALTPVGRSGKIDDFEWYEFDDHVIYVNLPIVENDDNLSTVVGDEYFLTTKYKQTYPEVRYKYLKWLQDVSKTPEANGFLGNYLACLERSAIEVDFKQSLGEINLLINSHQENKSFLRAACRSVLLLGLHQKEYALILNLYAQNKVEISLLVLNAFFVVKKGLAPKVIAEIFKKLQLKLGAVKGYEATFEKCIEDILIAKCGLGEILISDYTTLDNCPVKVEKLYNYNLSVEIGHIKVYEIWYDEKLNEMLREIHFESYEMIKDVKKELRKSASRK